jgi:hypothetical protein
MCCDTDFICIVGPMTAGGRHVHLECLGSISVCPGYNSSIVTVRIHRTWNVLTSNINICLRLVDYNTLMARLIFLVRLLNQTAPIIWSKANSAVITRMGRVYVEFLAFPQLVHSLYLRQGSLSLPEGCGWWGVAGPLRQHQYAGGIWLPCSLLALRKPLTYRRVSEKARRFYDLIFTQKVSSIPAEPSIRIW